MLEAEDLLTIFTFLDVAQVDLPTSVAARIERIPGFLFQKQHAAPLGNNPAALSALMRDIVGPVIKDVIGSIDTQLDEVL